MNAPKICENTLR